MEHYGFRTLFHIAGIRNMWNKVLIEVSMEQKLWNFYQDSVPHVSDSGDMEQSSETSIKTLFHMFRIPAIWNKVLKP